VPQTQTADGAVTARDGKWKWKRTRTEQEPPLRGFLKVLEIMGVATVGVYGYIYPPKSVQVNFLWGRNDVRTAID